MKIVMPFAKTELAPFLEFKPPWITYSIWKSLSLLQIQTHPVAWPSTAVKRFLQYCSFACQLMTQYHHIAVTFTDDKDGFTYSNVWIFPAKVWTRTRSKMWRTCPRMYDIYHLIFSIANSKARTETILLFWRFPKHDRKMTPPPKTHGDTTAQNVQVFDIYLQRMKPDDCNFKTVLQKIVCVSSTSYFLQVAQHRWKYTSKDERLYRASLPFLADTPARLLYLLTY